MRDSIPPSLTPAGQTRRSPWQEPPPPEPLAVHEPPPARSLLRRALSPPGLAAIVVLLSVLTVAVVSVLTVPHDPEFDRGDVSRQASHADGMDAGEGLGLHVAADGGAEGEAGGAWGGVGNTASTALITVHVVGEVNTPGVVELPQGARVAAAIDAAGGATGDAALAGVNLARVLSDGEQIAVPNAEQVAAANDVAGSGADGVGGVAAVGTDGRVNLNVADAATLDQLPRVGPSLAQRIIEWREVNGPFTSIDQLLDISGIGQKTFDDLRNLVTL